jgi:hypothetical protein
MTPFNSTIASDSKSVLMNKEFHGKAIRDRNLKDQTTVKTYNGLILKMNTLLYG